MTLKIRGMCIVLVGDFTPRMFHPAWFGKHGMLGPSEVAAAELHKADSDEIAFRLDWLKLKVTRRLFSVEVRQDANFGPGRDIVLGAFELTSHTPLREMEINTYVHYKMKSKAAVHDFLRVVAPSQPWQGVLDDPWLAGLAMQAVRPDGRRGHLQVHVQPSSFVTDGVYVNISDHYVFGEHGILAVDAMEILRNDWQSSSKRSRDIIRQLVKNR